MISISPATSSEIATVLTFVEKLLIELSDEGDEFSGLDRGKTLRDIAANADRFNPFLAKNERGEVVGVMTVVETFAIYAGGNYGVIDELYVAPEYRSQGVGEAFIEAVKALGKAKNWVRVDVTAPPEEKWRRTVAFYERQGFVFTGPKLRWKIEE
ncbi:MAG TPA: GNAT family N-acetyltransferase [Anaerolineales bacterium]|nr:GNAT family N-acetyltransferase [Anaerolineales bacterium]